MLNTLHRHLQDSQILPPGSKLVVAISGGVDSVTLLHLLHNLRQQYSWKLILAHYNHGVRKDASKDAILAGDLADSYGYQFLLGKYEYTNFSEASLRRARYEFLESIRRDSGFDIVVTAHHNNDFLETAIFNTIRGADREGMVALKPRRGHIVRPLLPFSKAEIITFANIRNLAYREDSTNTDMKYSRNFVRGVLMPHGSTKFRSFSHNLNRRLARMEELNASIATGLDRLATQTVSYEDSKSIEIKRNIFNPLDINIQKNLLVFLIKRLDPGHKFTKASIGRMLNFIQYSKSGTTMNFSGGLNMVNTYDTLVITLNQAEYTAPQKASIHILSESNPFRNEVFKLGLTGKVAGAVRVPQQKMYVRYRQSGDKIYPIGMSGSKKLQDVFVDAKIPRHLRSRWPIVVTANNEVVMVPKLATDRQCLEGGSGKYQYLICEVI